MAGNRWQLGVGLLGIASWLVGQAPPGSPGGHPTPAAVSKRGTELPPTHRPLPAPTPFDALSHLQATAAAAAAERSGRTAPATAKAATEKAATGKPAAAERPAGLGRYVAAVVTCADADLDCAALFGVPRRDLLVLATPGGLVDADAVALLEAMASEQRLGLVVLLGHDDCASRTIGGASRAQRLFAKRLAVAGCEAAAPAAATLALLAAQRDALLAASDDLTERVAQDGLRIVAARREHGEGGDTVRWLLARSATMPIAPVK